MIPGVPGIDGLPGCDGMPGSPGQHGGGSPGCQCEIKLGYPGCRDDSECSGRCCFYGSNNICVN